MRKKLTLIVFSVIALGALFIVLYDQFRPKTSATLMRGALPKSGSVLKLNQVQDFFSRNQGEHILFLRDSDADSEYVSNTILAPLESNQYENASPELITIDMEDSQSTSVTRLKQVLGVEKFPAFVVVEVKDGNYSIKSTLIYDSEKPFTSEDLKTWFFTNNAWKGPIDLEKKSN